MEMSLHRHPSFRKSVQNHPSSRRDSQPRAGSGQVRAAEAVTCQIKARATSVPSSCFPQVGPPSPNYLLRSPWSRGRGWPRAAPTDRDELLHGRCLTGFILFGFFCCCDLTHPEMIRAQIAFPEYLLTVLIISWLLKFKSGLYLQVSWDWEQGVYE